MGGRRATGTGRGQHRAWRVSCVMTVCVRRGVCCWPCGAPPPLPHFLPPPLLCDDATRRRRSRRGHPACGRSRGSCARMHLQQRCGCCSQLQPATLPCKRQTHQHDLDNAQHTHTLLTTTQMLGLRKAWQQWPACVTVPARTQHRCIALASTSASLATGAAVPCAKAPRRAWRPTIQVQKNHTAPRSVHDLQRTQLTQ
jgi:hypothetical protein